MKITISHDQTSIDPSGTYSAKAFSDVRKNLETEYTAAIHKVFPDAEIEYLDSLATYSIRVTQTGLDDPSPIEAEIQAICEAVFETGTFWI